MSEPKIVFDHVWKKFRRGERYDSLRDLIPAAAARMVGRGKSESAALGEREFWAVQDVSFEVMEGRALGVIGPNGAGKSTTLKLLTKVLRPTRGEFRVKGRIGALIEIAAGFHPDLTGRENIFLQGTIMGMKHREIREKVDEIIAFAGVESFVDSPVKRYSSGMNARLGFSIAAHLDPDVLIIDEVLSVGDAAFQERCIRRMLEFKQRGVALVFVSHNLQAISQLCDQALFLKGATQAIGQPAEVIRRYLETAMVREQTDSGSPIDVVEARLLDSITGEPVSVVEPGRRLTLRARYMVREAVEGINLTLVCYRSTDMLTVYDGNFRDEETHINQVAPGNEIEIDLDLSANLTRGQYHLKLEVFHNPTQTRLSSLSPAAMLTVEENRTYDGIADLAVNPVVHTRD
ncbi:MAG: ABC transporter ATP-binding protein [Gemmatimonadota bacterium]|jgi:lipopolysaccharide transport system ATP-binding protein|nr:ABC transporter ATP-binding protein [Gemmatimonadota bacterium]